MTAVDQGLSEQYLLTIGALLLVGLFASTVARRTFLPRVTILLLLGFGLGSDGVGVIPSWLTSNFQIIADNSADFFLQNSDIIILQTVI